MDSIDYVMYSSSEILEANVEGRNYYFGYMIKPLAIRCAIELGVPDAMHNHGQPISLSELVASLQIHPSKTHCLYRLLSVLAHTGFFAKHVKQKQPHQEEAKYSLTLAFHHLPKERWPTKPAPTISLSHKDSLYLNPMLNLSAWFKSSDKTVLETAQQRGLWNEASMDTKFNSKFNEMMAEDSRIISMVMLRECREVLEDVKSLVDVGGGTGTMAKAIADAFPHKKCTVLDLPHVVAGLQGTKNLDFVGGNMFEAIPPSNAILLKSILHNWNDEDCVRILKLCKEAIPRREEGGKVMIIEIVVSEENKKIHEAQLYLDIVMMVLLSGKERDQMEWEKLFFAAGFSDYKITHAFGDRSLIEVYP